MKTTIFLFVLLLNLSGSLFADQEVQTLTEDQVSQGETCYFYPPRPFPPRYPHYPSYPNYPRTPYNPGPRGYWQCTAYNRYNQPTTIANYNLQAAAQQALYLCGGPQWCYIPHNGCLFICN